MLVEFWESSDLKRIVESLRVITRQINFDFSKDGLLCQSLDPSHVTLARITVPCQCFRRYKCDTTYAIGLDLDNLYTILRAIKDRSPILLEYNGKEKLAIQTSAGEIKFNIKVLDLDHLYVELPETVPDCRIEMDVDLFCKLIKDLLTIKCDSINFVGKSNELLVKGFNLSGTDTTFTFQNNKDVIMDLKSEININFDLIQLFELSKNFKGLGTLVISLSNDNPLFLRFRTRFYTLNYYLSPLLIN